MDSVLDMKLLQRNDFRLFLVVYCSFVHVFERACCNTLPGSCIAAGHTTCCSNKAVENCAGDSAVCFCDPVCQEYQDCCADLGSICPEISASQHSSLKVLESSVTFSSATVRWISLLSESQSPGSGFETDDSDLTTSTNTATYTISYYTPDNVSAVLTVSVLGRTAEIHSSLLTNLKPRTHYFYFITESSDLGVVGSKVDTFTTLHYPLIQQLEVEVMSPSTVRVLWSAVQLPHSVQILHYTVYYGQNGTELLTEYSAHYNHREIAGLHSGVHYSFSVSVTITDVDGSVLEGNRSSVSTVFIPATSMFQLMAGPFQACNHWSEATEATAIQAFHNGVLQAIENQCNCQFPSRNIDKEVIICEADNAAKTVTTSAAQAVYRASILSTPALTASELVTAIQRWALTAPVLRTEQAGLQLSLDSSCPVGISRMSEPLCSVCSDCSGVVTEKFSQTPNNGSTVAEKCISLPVFVAALLAELLFCAVIMMVGVVIALLASHISKRKESRTQLENHRPTAASNLYTSGPVTADNQASRDPTTEPHNSVTASLADSELHS